MQQSRKELTQAADRLGIPWTNATTDEELHALVTRQEEGETMEVNIVETEENGEVVKKVNGAVAPECFSIWWEALDTGSLCDNCGIKNQCLHVFATETLPEIRKSMGSAASLADVAERAGVVEGAVLQAMAYSERQQADAEGAPEKPERKPVLSVVPDPEPEVPDSAELQHNIDDPPLEILESEEEPETEEPEEEEVEETEEETETEEVEEPEEEEPEVVKAKAKKKATKKAAKKKAAKKKAAKKTTKKKAAKKKAKKSKAKAVVNPPKATSAKSAKGVASKKGKTAKTAKARAGTPRRPKDSEPWGEHTFRLRYERERAKSPAIAGLTPGAKLERTYKGKTYKVECLKPRFYQFNGTTYPTLYSIVKEITGTEDRPKQKVARKGKMVRPKGTRQICNWSAPKFFNLKRLASQS